MLLEGLMYEKGAKIAKIIHFERLCFFDERKNISKIMTHVCENRLDFLSMA